MKVFQSSNGSFKAQPAVGRDSRWTCIRWHWGVYPYFLNAWDTLIRMWVLVSCATAVRAGPAGGQADLCHSSSTLWSIIITLVFHTSCFRFFSKKKGSPSLRLCLLKGNPSYSKTVNLTKQYSYFMYIFRHLHSCIWQVVLSKVTFHSRNTSTTK